MTEQMREFWFLGGSEGWMCRCRFSLCRCAGRGERGAEKTDGLETEIDAFMEMIIRLGEMHLE
jgi:hypothetical protein